MKTAPPIIANPETLTAAMAHLQKHDDKLAPIISSVGPPKLQPHTNYYWELVDSIISQQLSVKAAATIEKRFRALFDTEFPLPEAIWAMPEETLRGAGLSRAKAVYIRDLARHIMDGKLTFDQFDRMPNDAIIAELITVKGIGNWTAQMFLIFCLARLDVLATGDLGIRNGIKQLYGLETVPTEPEVTKIAGQNGWHPYESVACWYIWQSIDNAPAL